MQHGLFGPQPVLHNQESSLLYLDKKRAEIESEQ